MMSIAAIQQKLPAIDASILAGRQIQVDGQRTTLKDFLYTNLCDEDVDHISIGDAKEVVALNIGETMYIGTSTIKRVK